MRNKSVPVKLFVVFVVIQPLPPMERRQIARQSVKWWYLNVM
jgi:hypothetical protein